MKEDVTGFVNDDGQLQVRVLVAGPGVMSGEPDVIAIYPLLDEDFDGELMLLPEGIDQLVLPSIGPDAWQAVIHWAKGTQTVSVVPGDQCRIGRKLLAGYKVVGEKTPRSPIFLEWPEEEQD